MSRCHTLFYFCVVWDERAHNRLKVCGMLIFLLCVLRHWGRDKHFVGHVKPLIFVFCKSHQQKYEVRGWGAESGEEGERWGKYIRRRVSY